MALAACASPQAQQRAAMANMAERVLERAGSIGDPGRVAAADFAFARMARDEGQWTAFAATAADGALIHGSGGTFPAAPWLAQQSNPAQAVVWGPNTVWSSCDGTLAVSFGRFEQPDGLVGNYVTVWELQPDRSYKWIYDMGGPDNPQPPPRTGPVIPEGEEAIIVPGLTSIEGRIADCAVPGEVLPEISVAPLADGQSGGTVSADGTLRWTWTHSASGNRSVRVNWVRDGMVQEALAFTAPLPLAQ
ncbi:MAG: hypothetical protein JY451_09535 [Erythrobacter sp.]|nr:MAG: hypothetical protein JY451_09535 [Erythrobacter sp.]